MPRILFPTQIMLTRSSKGSCLMSNSQGNGANWGYYGKSNGSSSSSSSAGQHGSVELRNDMTAERRQSMEEDVSSRCQQDSSLVLLVGNEHEPRDRSNSTTIDGAGVSDEWGFFVDIAPAEEQEAERVFLNGFRQDSKPLKTIVDSGL